MFALQGLTDAAGDSALPISYKLSPYDVMVNTANYFRSRSMLEFLKTLRFAGIGWERNETTLPSWMVDWTKESTVPPLAIMYLGNSELDDRATANEIPYILSGLEEHTLRAKGICVDSVEVLGPLFKFKIHGGSLYHMPDAVLNIAAFLKEAEYIVEKHVPDLYYNGQSSSEVLWRTLVCNRADYKKPAPVDYGRYFEEFKESIVFALALESAIKDIPLSQRTGEVPDHVWERLPPYTEDKFPDYVKYMS